MPDIDLIPSDYRQWLWQRQWLRRSAVTLVGGVALTVAAWFAVDGVNEERRNRIAELEKLRTDSTSLATAISAGRDKLAFVRSQLAMLEGLRSGAAAQDILVMVDRALADEDVWFDNWEFERVGVIVPEAPETVSTGYFIVVPSGSSAETGSDSKMVRTNMRIRGQASDHSSLSTFVRNLFAQPEIDDVRVERTYSGLSGRESVVNFDLAIVLTTRAGSNG